METKDNLVEFEKTLQEKDETIKNLQSELDKMKADVELKEFEAKKEKIKSYLEEKVKEKKIVPAQVPSLMALAMGTNDMIKFEFTENDKKQVIEGNAFELLKNALENTAQVNFEQQTYQVEVNKNVYSNTTNNENDELDKKIKVYMNENKVSYAQAYDALSKEVK